MKRKFIKYKNQSIGFNKFLSGFVSALIVFAGFVAFAQTDIVQNKWNAIWHGTDWIDHGSVIDAQKVAENFEYLYKELEKIKKDPPIRKGTITAGCMVYILTEFTPGKTNCGYVLVDSTTGESSYGANDNAVSEYVCTYTPSRETIISKETICWGGAKMIPVYGLVSDSNVRVISGYGQMKVYCPINTKRIDMKEGFLCYKE